MEKKQILTDGAKRRLQEKLQHLLVLIEEEHDRETIMWRAAEIMPACVSEMNYYTPAKKIQTQRKRPLGCGGIIDPARTRGLLRRT